MTAALRKRLHRLETIYPKLPEPCQSPAVDPHHRDILQCLFSRMSPEYAQQAQQDLFSWAQSDFKDFDKCTTLLTTVFRYVESHIKEGRPLELPVEVLELYLAEEYAAPLNECEDCGYALPRLWIDPPPPARGHFDRCPLCGGKVGWEGSYIGKSPTAPNGGVAVQSGIFE
jgi:hypothetical protein